VAIATALVPPLAACGLNLAAGNWILAWGAFLLFLINFIAIEFAAAALFMLLGVVEFPRAGNGSLLKAVLQRLGISFLILIMAASFMTQTLITIIGERKLDKEIRDVLTQHLTTYAGARLSDIRYSQSDGGLEVRAVVITPQEFDPTRVASLEEALQAKINPNTQLIVRSLISKDADRNGPVFISAEEVKQRSETSQEAAYMNQVSLILSEQLKTINGAQVSNVTKEITDDIPIITASVRTYQAITPAEVQGMQQRLNDEVDNNIRLIVRSTITRDANAQEFLHQTVDFKSTLQGDDLKLYDSLVNEIKWYLSQNIAGGVTISELSFQRADDTVNVYSAVDTPVTVDPALVSKLQWNLQNYIDPRIKITVKSIVGGTATANAYVTATDAGQ